MKEFPSMQPISKKKILKVLQLLNHQIETSIWWWDISTFEHFSDLLFQKVQSFDQSKLKKVETNEKSILNQEKSILEAANYDQSKLNKVEAVEKNVLPTDDGK